MGNYRKLETWEEDRKYFEQKYDKVIFACNNDDCPIEYEHVLIRAGQSLHLEEEGMFCTFCEHPMVFCERIEEAGDL